MCLVSYVKTEDGYVLSSNRDESPFRRTSTIEKFQKNGLTVYYPVDPMGGSWIFTSTDRRLICLLNGAFEQHQRRNSYRESRGVVIRSYFDYDEAADFFRNVNLHGIEPFTLIVVDRDLLFEFRWDYRLKHVRRLDSSESYIWSSSTLYDKENRERRESVFRKKLKNLSATDEDTIASIHLLEDDEDPENAFRMNRRDLVKTISLSQYAQHGEKGRFRHTDLESGQMQTVQIS